MPKDFATKLVSLRGERNLTQQQLADAIGITPSQISRYESGQAKPRRTVLFKLAEALGVSVDDLKEAVPSKNEYRLHEGFSTRFLNARNDANISLKTLSEMTRIAPEVLSAFELGETIPCTDDLIRLSSAFGIPVEALRGAKDEEDVVRIRLAVDNSDAGDVIAVTPESYATLVSLGTRLGVSTEEALNLFLDKFLEVASDPSQASHPFMDIITKLKSQK